MEIDFEEIFNLLSRKNQEEFIKDMFGRLFDDEEQVGIVKGNVTERDLLDYISEDAISSLLEDVAEDYGYVKDE